MEVRKAIIPDWNVTRMKRKLKMTMFGEMTIESKQLNHFNDIGIILFRRQCFIWWKSKYAIFFNIKVTKIKDSTFLGHPVYTQTHNFFSLIWRFYHEIGINFWHDSAPSSPTKKAPVDWLTATRCGLVSVAMTIVSRRWHSPMGPGPEGTLTRAIWSEFSWVTMKWPLSLLILWRRKKRQLCNLEHLKGSTVNFLI